MVVLWHHFENQYLRNRQIIINNFIAVANVYFIDGPISNLPTTIETNTIAPTPTITNTSTTNDTTTNAPIIRRQRPLRIRTSRKKYNFITTIETERYTGDQKEECPICLDDVKCVNFVKLNCNHKFCVRCIVTSVKTNRKDNYHCALCRCNTELVRVYNTNTYNLVKNL
jgi:hypothetical protein